MKSALALLLVVVAFLAIVVENQGQEVGASHYPYPGGGGGSNKPGSCYRPGFGGGRRRRSAEDLSEEDDQIHEVQKREIGSNGYNHGANPWRPPRPTTTRRPPSYIPRCSRDSQCAGNKKCCSGQCQTPSYVG